MTTEQQIKLAESLYPTVDNGVLEFFDASEKHIEIYTRELRQAFIAGLNHHTCRWVEVGTYWPIDGSLVWFYSSQFKHLFFGNFFSEDAFERKNVFISKDGGHFDKNVSHFIQVTRPAPPSETPTTALDVDVKEYEKEINELNEECKRLHKVAEHWHLEYNKLHYEKNKHLPGFGSGKIDNL